MSEINAMDGNAETRDRTGDLQIFGLTLSQLSYRGHTHQFTTASKSQNRMTNSTWNVPTHSQGTPHVRHREDSNPCGQSPMDFESISLTAQTQCQWRVNAKFACYSHWRWALPGNYLQCDPGVQVGVCWRSVVPMFLRGFPPAWGAWQLWGSNRRPCGLAP